MKKIVEQDKGMIDISDKKISRRRAKAYCAVKLPKKYFIFFLKNGSPKGNVFETAKIAGLLAAKKTADIIPMCHPLLLNTIDINFHINKKKNIIEVYSEVICDGKTGVEMEALTAVSIAALTVYDMLKFFCKTITITDLKLIFKSGGKSGIYKIKH